MTETVIGLLADSHIPDRRKNLHPDMLQRLRDEKVELILHAGDIALPRVLEQLEAIAPVYAVRGNYDFLFFPPLPMKRVIEVQGVRIGLTHGHGGLAKYVQDKYMYIIGRYKGVDFFADRAESMVPEDVDIVCYGHSHFPMQKMKGSKLIVNPGSCSSHLYYQKEQPSFGLLRVEGKKFSVEIVYLNRAKF